MKRKFFVLFFIGLFVASCQQKKSEPFLETKEDCGCDDVDTSQVN